MHHSTLYLLLAILIAIVITNVVSDKSSIKLKKGAPHIQLSYGLLSGTIKESRNGRSYYAFMGVPYANPPRRFERSVILNRTWQSVKPAHRAGARCPQNSFWTAGGVFGEEDCLFTNIYIPIKPLMNQTLPVMVWIHGGGFRDGEGDSYGPEYFMDQDVIIVTINYRLGALGFLSTEDEVVPGNNGLHDQVVALHWVQKNIAAFGGDPNRVTIFGESAGAASVNYLMLSPLAKGLFRNAICISGTALDPWANIRHPLERANELGKSLNCSTRSSLELVNCLKKQKADDILLHSKKLLKWNIDPAVIFGPTVEKFNKKDAVIPDTPERLIETGNFNKVPLIIGVNEQEGLLIQSSVILQSEKLTKELNEEWNTYAPITFVYDDRFKKEDLPIVSEKIRKFYFGDKPVGLNTRENLTNLYSDVYFIYGTRKTALSISQHVPVYLYMYSYRTTFSLTKLFGIKEVTGTTHADDLHMYFTTENFGPPIKKDSPSYEFSEHLVKLWVYFAADGKPTKTWDAVQKWEPVNRKQIENGKPLKWFNIDEKTKTFEDPFLTRMQFWSDLFRDYTQENSHRDEL